jgi:hypothetical protein
MCSAASRHSVATAPISEVEMKAMPYHVVHAKLGHMGEDATRKAVNYLGFPITTGTSSPCISCSDIKVKKKTFTHAANKLVGPLNKSSDDAKAPIGTRFYLDEASVRISQEGFQMTKPTTYECSLRERHN